MTDAPKTMSDDQVNFYRTERASLAAIGIHDYDAQCKELERRWNVIKAMKAKPEPPTVRLEQPLSQADLQASSLYLVEVDTSAPAPIFVYGQVVDVDHEAEAEEAAAAAAAPPSRKRRLGNDGGASSSASFGNERAIGAPPPILALLTALKKDTLQNICEDIGVAVSGNKDELMARVLDKLIAD